MTDHKLIGPFMPPVEDPVRPVASPAGPDPARIRLALEVLACVEDEQVYADAMDDYNHDGGDSVGCGTTAETYRKKILRLANERVKEKT